MARSAGRRPASPRAHRAARPPPLRRGGPGSCAPAGGRAAPGPGSLEDALAAQVAEEGAQAGQLARAAEVFFSPRRCSRARKERISRWSTSARRRLAAAAPRRRWPANCAEVLAVGAQRCGGTRCARGRGGAGRRRCPRLQASARGGGTAAARPGLSARRGPEALQAAQRPLRRGPAAAAPCRGCAAAARAAGRRRCWWAGSGSGSLRAMYRPSAPSAVSSGRTGGSSPRARKAAPDARQQARRPPTPRSPRRPTSGRRRRGPGRRRVSKVGSRRRGRVDVGVAVDHAEAHELGLAPGPGSCRNTRFCSPHLSWVWNPTIEKWLAARLSWRSCTTAKGRRPVRGSARPTGFMGPKQQGVAAAAGDHLHRQAALEEELVLEGVEAGALGGGEGLDRRRGTPPRRAGSSRSRRRPCRSARRGRCASKSMVSASTTGLTAS